MTLRLRPLEDGVALLVREVTKRHVGAHSEFPGHHGHVFAAGQPPRSDRALVERQRGVGHQRRTVDARHHAKTLTPGACPERGGRERLGPRHREGDPVDRAGEAFGHPRAGHHLHEVPLGAGMGAEAAEAEPQHRPDLGQGRDGGARAGRVGALPQRERGRDVLDRAHPRRGRLPDPASLIGRQPVEIAAGALRVEHPQRERGLPRSTHPGHPDVAVEENVDVQVGQVVHRGAAHLDGGRQGSLRHAQTLVGAARATLQTRSAP